MVKVLKVEPISKVPEAFIDGHAGGGEIAEPLAFNVFLHPGDALVVDIDVTDDIGRGRTTGIEAALFGTETDAGNTEREDLALLLGRQLATQPLEARGRGELAINRAHIEIGQHGHEPLDGLVGINDLVGLGIERNRADVGGKHFAVAVDEIRTRGHQLVGGADGGNGLFALHPVLNKPRADDGVEHAETENCDQDAAARLLTIGRALALEFDMAARLGFAAQGKQAQSGRECRYPHHGFTDPVVRLASGVPSPSATCGANSEA